VKKYRYTPNTSKAAGHKGTVIRVINNGSANDVGAAAKKKQQDSFWYVGEYDQTMYILIMPAQLQTL